MNSKIPTTFNEDNTNAFLSQLESLNPTSTNEIIEIVNMLEKICQKLSKEKADWSEPLVNKIKETMLMLNLRG